ncbi:hypothetical protein BpHYR1_001736 [Brachionus plicatilis]|uniref:Uncharacterized protein n=1 Tax=Brachionus plicatilis TaxID=10195 RepID=A0A3M7QG84_BRAPC|nr:hypothetical protein BpHYR1_001736 [Brachionus plicatilis]
MVNILGSSTKVLWHTDCESIDLDCKSDVFNRPGAGFDFILGLATISFSKSFERFIAEDMLANESFCSSKKVSFRFENDVIKESIVYSVQVKKSNSVVKLIGYNPGYCFILSNCSYIINFRKILKQTAYVLEKKNIKRLFSRENFLSFVSIKLQRSLIKRFKILEVSRIFKVEIRKIIGCIFSLVLKIIVSTCVCRKLEIILHVVFVKLIACYSDGKRNIMLIK